MRSLKLLLADPKGQVFEHPWLLASLRSDESLLPPRERPIPLPEGAKLAHLPGRLPVGFDPDTMEPVLVREFEVPMGTWFGSLSRGTRTKAALALALARHAELLVLDEPTAGLDPVFRRSLLERLAAYVADGRASVLFSTHITSDLERVADVGAVERREIIPGDQHRQAARIQP